MGVGFLAMPGIIPFPPLGGTAGLGGLNDELIPFPEVGGLIEGFEPNVAVAATTLRGPKTTLFATAPAPAAKVQLSAPSAPTKRAPSVKVTITREPKKKG